MQNRYLIFILVFTLSFFSFTRYSLAHRTEVDLLDTEAAKTIVLAKLGSETGKQGNKEKGLEILQLAIQAAETIRNPLYREAALAQIANELAALGSVEKALTITRSFKDVHFYVTTLGKIAQKESGNHQIAFHLLEEAVLKAMSAENLVERGALLAEIAGKYEKLGRHETALELLTRASELADKTDAKDVSEKVALLAEIAANLTASGEPLAAAARFEQATLLALTIHDPFQQAACLSMLGGELAEKGQPDKALILLEQALKVAERIQDNHQREDLLSEIARNYSQSKNCDKASLIAAEITDGYYKTEALIRISKNYQKQHQNEKAVRVLMEAKRTAVAIDNPMKKSMMLAKISSEFTDGKQLDEARVSLEEATSLLSSRYL